MSESRSGLAGWIAGQDSARLGAYTFFHDFYSGHQWGDLPRVGERRLTVNYARTVLRKTVSYLFSEPVKQSVPLDNLGAASRRHQAAEAALAEVAAENDLDRIDFDTAVSAAILGDGAFKVTWDPIAQQVVVAPVDVTGLWAWWHPDDLRRVYRVIQRYVVPLEAAGLYGLTAADRLTATGQGLTVIEDWWADRFVLEVGGRVVRDGPNPYPWLPYIIFPNETAAHRFWGLSDLVDLVPVIRELNRRLSVVSQVLDLSGAPIAVLENVEGSDGIMVAPGAKWELPADARAYLLDLLQGRGLDLHVRQIELIYRALHDIAETPRTAFGDGGQTLSGVALEVELQPLIQKIKRKRAVWTTVYRRRSAMILDLLARFGGREFGTRRTVPIWGAITPRDRSVLVRDEAALVAAGIHSRQRAAERLGDENAAAEFAAVLDEARRLGQTPPHERSGPHP